MIFDSFSQADYSSTRKHGGTGLGLAIAKQLITLLGGELTLISEEGKGSVFSLLVPVGMVIADQPLSDENNVAAHSDKDELSEFHGHILVAEDIKPSQVLIKTILNRMGIEVTVVEEGRAVVEKAQSNGFDLILMDMMMPDMNGYEATKVLREEGVKTPIVALTANAMKTDRQKCIDAGCDDYLSKPIDIELLVVMLQKYLRVKV